MKSIDYAQSVVLSKVYEKRLLGKAKLNRMIDAKDEVEAFKILMDSEYSKSANNVYDVYGYVTLLNQEVARVKELAAELLQDEKILEIMTLKYDYHNLKIIVKSLYVDKDLTEKFIQSKNANPQTILAQVRAEKYTTIRDEFASAIKEAISEFEKTKDPQMIDIVIDKNYFSHIRKLYEELGIEYFKKYTQAEIDFYNVSTLMRIRKMNKSIAFSDKVLFEGGNIEKNKLISLLNADIDKIILSLKGESIGSYLQVGLEYYKKTGSLLKLEKQRKAFLEELNKEARFITFGPEPIISYIISKENEIDTIRFILVGKLNNISPDKIRERLGE